MPPRRPNSSINVSVNNIIIDIIIIALNYSTWLSAKLENIESGFETVVPLGHLVDC